MVKEELTSTHVSNLKDKKMSKSKSSGKPLKPDAYVGLTPNPLTQCGPGPGNSNLMNRVRLTHLVFSRLQAKLRSDHSRMIIIYPTFTDLRERRYLFSSEFILITKIFRKVSAALACYLLPFKLKPPST